jgi:hypothetical protein
MATELAKKVAAALERNKWNRARRIMAGECPAWSPSTDELAEIVDAAGVAELIAENERLQMALIVSERARAEDARDHMDDTKSLKAKNELLRKERMAETHRANLLRAKNARLDAENERLRALLERADKILGAMSCRSAHADDIDPNEVDSLRFDIRDLNESERQS